MSRKKKLFLCIGILTLIVGLAVAGGCFRREATKPDEKPPQQSPGKDVAAKQFIGSEECGNCHKEIYKQWKDTFHALSLQQADWDKFELKGDFGAGKLSYGAMKEGGGEIVDIVLKEDGTVTIGDKDYKIFGTYGGWDNWKQRYLTKDVANEANDNAIHILPIQWNQKPEKWVPYHADEGHGEPNKNNWWRPGRTFEKNCAGCHNTGLALKWNNDGLVTGYQYSEFNTGCEDCHGPGSLHQNNPPGNIINPAKLDNKKTANEVCGQCHSRGKSKPNGVFEFPWAEKQGQNGAYEVGLDLDNYWSDKGGYYGEDRDDDGKVTLEESVASKKHHQQWWDHKVSAHYKSESDQAPKTCFDCHSPHDDGYRVGDKEYTKKEAGREMCLDCHRASPPFNGEEHHFGDSKYAAMAKTGCVSCHMTRTAKSAVWDEKGLGDIRSHRLNVFPPGFSTTYDMPNSCVECHDNATDEQVEEIADIVEQRQKK